MEIKGVPYNFPYPILSIDDLKIFAKDIPSNYNKPQISIWTALSYSAEFVWSYDLIFDKNKNEWELSEATFRYQLRQNLSKNST